MLIKRSDGKSFICDSYTTTLIWSSDGWVYDLINKSRRQFFSTTDKDIFEMKEEIGEFVITDIQHKETVQIKLISSEPRIWQEDSDVFCVINDRS